MQVNNNNQQNKIQVPTIGEIQGNEVSINLQRKLGEGGTSKVYLGNIKNNESQQFAVKVIKSGDSSDSKYFANEVKMLMKIKHPNVVRLLHGGEGIQTDEDGEKTYVCYLVLELIKYGELFDYVFFPQKGFGEEVGKYIFTQILDGLESCHKAGIVHRDMKTENIMLGADWQMKIADFGFATKSEGKKGNGLLYTALGTASYASPELLMKKPYHGVSSDIFSLGVSLFILVTGKMPFKHAIVDDPYYKEVVKMNYDSYWKRLEGKVPGVSDEFKQLFCMLIAFEPSNRPTIEEIRAHKWIKDYVPNMEKINKEFDNRNKVVQYKKELERKKEQQEKINMMNKKFQVYKSGGDEQEEYVPTPNDLDLKDVNETIAHPYVLRFKNDNAPGDLLDYIVASISQNKNIDVSTRIEDEYRINIGCKADNYETELNKEFVINPIEASLSILRDEDDLVVEFSRVSGNKFDYHNLYSEINELVKKGC